MKSESAEAERPTLDSLGRQERCLNCEAPRSDVFCERCGQRHVVERLSVRSILRELPARLFSLEHGLLATWLRLFRSPGTVARDYVYGRRARYTNPLAMFLIAASMQLLALAVISPQIKSRIVENLEQSRAQPGGNPSFDRMDGLLGERFEEKIADLYIATMNQGYTYAAFFFFCLPFAALLRMFHGRRGPGYRLGEHLIFTTYTVSQLLIVTALANLITARMGSAVQPTVSLLLYVVYAVIAHRGFFPRGIGSLARTLVAFVISVAFFFCSLIGVFTITFVIHMLLAKAAAGL